MFDAICIKSLGPQYLLRSISIDLDHPEMSLFLRILTAVGAALKFRTPTPTPLNRSEISLFLRILTAVGAAFIIRVLYVLFRRTRSKRSSPPVGPVRTMIVLGSGGHTAEMLSLTANISVEKYQPRQYVVAKSDSTSIRKLEVATKAPIPAGSVHCIPRSREVGQSWVTSFISTLYAIIWSTVLIARLRPALVLCNGPG